MAEVDVPGLARGVRERAMPGGRLRAPGRFPGLQARLALGLQQPCGIQVGADAMRVGASSSPTSEHRKNIRSAQSLDSTFAHQRL
ncbi:hypothetical protein [Streptomyces nigrescens]|uniref:hypothetical protein n=1 Tax=Streptomyces nigrescens TaxID=1920 RepID=UPI002403D8A0|nr:hypothetical protein [Streptomyces nigrescens]